MLRNFSLRYSVRSFWSPGLSRPGWRAFSGNPRCACSLSITASPPPAPPELTSVPSDEDQFPSSTCDDTTLGAPIGVPSLPVLQEEPSTSVTDADQALPSCPSSPPETPDPRPQRQRKPPSYLNDHVSFFAFTSLSFILRRQVLSCRDC